MLVVSLDSEKTMSPTGGEIRAKKVKLREGFSFAFGIVGPVCALDPSTKCITSRFISQEQVILEAAD